MLAPGLAAVITCLVFERSLRPISWRPGKIQYLILGLVIPIFYYLIEYSLVWLTGRGKYNGQFPPNILIFLVTMLVNGTLSAVLEEVAWRVSSLSSTPLLHSWQVSVRCLTATSSPGT